VLLLGLGTMFQVRQASEQALLDQLQEQSVALGRDMAARATDLILINDLYNLHQLLIETQVKQSPRQLCLYRRPGGGDSGPYLWPVVSRRAAGSQQRGRRRPSPYGGAGNQ
jgi:hypothetical protein